jgi:hypothetical protein
VRIHGETHQRPVDLFAQERAHLQPLNENRYDVARTATARASSQFRITFDANRYYVEFPTMSGNARAHAELGWNVRIT